MGEDQDRAAQDDAPIFGPEDLPVLAKVWIPLWIFDLDELFIRWGNRAALELWDAADLEELRARDFRSMSETSRTRTREMKQRLIAGQSFIVPWTFYPKGKAVPVRTRRSPYHLEDGRVAALTEALPLAADFDANSLRLVEAVRYLPANVAIHAASGEALIRNPQAARTYGALTDGANPLLGERWREAEARAALRAAMTQREPFHGEVGVETLAGPAWHHIEVRPTTDPVSGSPTLLVIETDVSEQRRAREELERARDEAERANRARSIFLANMSHEIRTPLTSILGIVELIDGLEDAEALSWKIGVIRESADLLMSVVNDILDLTKIDTGELHLEQIPFDARALVEGIISVCSARAEDKGVALSCVFEGELPAQVRGDPTRVRQILLNLVTNAIKFTAAGGSVTLSCASAARGLSFVVRDTGVGMSAEQLAKVFEPFVQADASTTRKHGGTGLGLPISAQLIDAMGGRLDVESEPGVGTTFFVELPLLAHDEHSAPLDVSARATGLRVLLAEDNRVNSMIVSKWLQIRGHEVLTASNGSEAVELVRAHADLDLVLMDIQMPVMDGAEATKQIRALGGSCTSLRIVALTADAMQSQVERYLTEGFDEYLTKPIDWERLERELRRALRSQGA